MNVIQRSPLRQIQQRNCRRDNWEVISITSGILLSDSTASLYTIRYSANNQETEYTISIVSDQGCKVTDTLLVKVNGSGPTGVASDLFVPNAWTPNGDGVNDRLFPLTENVVKLNFFRVFNRWGQLMFETSTIGDGWDGVFNGKPMMMDTYTWTAEAVGIDGKTFRRSGNAVLIR